MKKITIQTVVAAAALALVFSSTAFAKVTAQEAERLKSELTPVGAEKAGNADGSIPAWEGGLTKPPEGLGYKGPGNTRPDPFASDKPILTINAKNVDQYAAKLSPGVVAVIKRFPDTFYLDVYKTRRTAAAPQWVYDHTYDNATRCDLTPDGLGVIANGGRQGIPFPIPKRAEEVVFNDLLTYTGGGLDGSVRFSVVQANGSRADTTLEWQMKYPWYDQNGKESDALARMLDVSVAWYAEPANMKGNVVMLWDPLNQSQEPRSAWSYLPGQRRVRRDPTVAYDTPNTVVGAICTQDDIYGFNGALDRYNWKIVGKKEMYIPYNDYQTGLCSMQDLLKPNHYNPKYMRWELHRVWVIDAELKPGARHIYSHRVLYLDEDTWAAGLADNYDGHGKLWRTWIGGRSNAYEVPTVIVLEQFFFDLQRSDYAALYLQNDTGKQMLLNKFAPDSVFTPENVRTLGTR
jgi:hypothetical protein